MGDFGDTPNMNLDDFIRILIGYEKMSVLDFYVEPDKYHEDENSSKRREIACSTSLGEARFKPVQVVQRGGANYHYYYAQYCNS